MVKLTKKGMSEDMATTLVLEGLASQPASNVTDLNILPLILNAIEILSCVPSFRSTECLTQDGNKISIDSLIEHVTAKLLAIVSSLLILTIGLSFAD